MPGRSGGSVMAAFSPGASRPDRARHRPPARPHPQQHATSRISTSAVSPVQIPASPQPNTSDAHVNGRNPAAAATRVQVRR